MNSAIWVLLSISIILVAFVMIVSNKHDSMTEDDFKKAEQFSQKISKYRVLILILLALSIIIGYFSYN
jgi:ABC-type Fe3+-siderophore transport system permease subunit